MKVIFMGTPDFAVPCLKALVESRHNVIAVFTQPDKPRGRGYAMCPPPVKETALELVIPVFQPQTLKSDEAFNCVSSFGADIIVVAAYGKILPLNILECTKYGCINVHASLLPKYRGAAPIQRAVLEGEKETGITIQQMAQGIDTGDIIYAEKTDIGVNETAPALFDRLADMGATALLKAMDMLEDGSANHIKQDEAFSSYAKMIDKSMCPVDWSKTATQVHNQIRGLAEWPVANTTLNGKVIRLHLSALSLLQGGAPGEVMAGKSAFIVSCGDGKCVELLEVQQQGKKRMKAQDFLRGNPVAIKTVIGD